ncbi:MAG: type IV pili twitching motility protein PilT, partial [Syntrophomonadaceae bacterium]|nr:type IV pili twitching motility protein PilT [Syntrophomonadaceae bacterium]
MELKNLLAQAIQLQASDLHLKSGNPPVLRINGQIVAMDHQIISPAETRFV